MNEHISYINNNMPASESEEEVGQPQPEPQQQVFLGMEKHVLVRMAVCVFTLWLMLLLLTLLVVVGMYTSHANQILVVSSVAVISIALVVASCKLNALSGMSKMVAEEVAAKADPPPTYEDVLHSEAPPPPYFAVVNEAAGVSVGISVISGRSPKPAVPRVKEGTSSRPEDLQSSYAAFRRWVVRPGILQSVKSRAARGPPAALSPPLSMKGGGLSLRRSSSTPSLAGLVARAHPMARCPSTPALCDPCGCY